jgi:hypothetical protein
LCWRNFHSFRRRLPNINIPDTATHFIPDALWRHASHGTLAQWEERRENVRGQILSAAGLDPLPERIAADVDPEADCSERRVRRPGTEASCV